MYSDLEIVLYESAANTLELMGFNFTGLVTEEQQLQTPVNFSVGVEFYGPIQGRVHVTLCGELVRELTSSMLGEEHPASDEDQIDALTELANIICGNLLPHIAGTEAVFDVKTPCVYPPNTFITESPSPAAQTEIGFQRGRAEIALYISQT